jgi:hypothetical protein
MPAATKNWAQPTHEMRVLSPWLQASAKFRKSDIMFATRLPGVRETWTETAPILSQKHYKESDWWASDKAHLLKPNQQGIRF